jgi:hypothetical protein
MPRAEHTIRLDDGTRIELYVAAGRASTTTNGNVTPIRMQHPVMAVLNGEERDTKLLTAIPPNWPELELLVREWVALKHPW